MLLANTFSARIIKRLLISSCLIILASCGGGGTSQDPPSKNDLEAPSLSNASNQTLFAGQTVGILQFLNTGGGELTECTAESLPEGLEIGISNDGNTCELTGVPISASSASQYTVSARNASGEDSANIEISVLSIALPALEDSEPQVYTVNVEIPTLRLTNAGGGELNACQANSLPTGLLVAISSDRTTCEITGIVSSTRPASLYTITAINASGEDSATVSIASTPPLPELENANAQIYTEGFQVDELAFENLGGGELTACEATLPEGLSIAVSGDMSTCVIQGTPTSAVANTTYTITAENIAGSDIANIDIQVDPPRPFVTTWKTDNNGETEVNQIMISTHANDPFENFTYNYNVDWGDGTSDSELTGDITHTYASAGTYTVSITGSFPGLKFSTFSFQTDNEKLLSVEQWGDIQWQTMEDAFLDCTNLVINAEDAPDLSTVTDMNSMFSGAATFNQDISHWDVSSVTNMSGMFANADAFNQDISEWDVSSVTSMRAMFAGADTFNQNLSAWDVSSVTNMALMFKNARDFNGELNDWDTSNVNTINEMFWGAEAFNQDLTNWDVSSITNMNNMFEDATSFNGDISTWDVSSVRFMSRMFANADAFNQGLNDWDVSSVSSTTAMFSGADSFNGNISDWDVSSVAFPRFMFSFAVAFNQDISNWDLSAAEDMQYMFSGASSFNQGIGIWDVSSVTNMSHMFSGADVFDQNLANWNVSAVATMENMFLNSELSTANYDSILIGWSALALQSDVTFNAEGSSYSASAQTARDVLTSDFNWTITDGGITP